MVRIRKKGEWVIWDMVRIRNEIRIRENWGGGREIGLGSRSENNYMFCFFVKYLILILNYDILFFFF